MKLRPVTKEDLKDWKYKDDRKCDNCENIGSYRTTDFYLCEVCMCDIVSLEVKEDE